MAPQRGREQFGPQRSFVVEMRARREAAGLSRNRLAEALGCTPQWLAKVESCEKAPSEGLADDLDTFFKSSGTYRRLWEQMIEARRQGLIPSGFRPLIEAEKEANQICLYEPELIPGLFQDMTYARMVLSVGRRPDKVEELLAIRMERQQLHEKADPPWIFLLIKEAVIRDLQPEVQAQQCKRLLDLASEAKISIQIVPKRAHVFQEGGFQVLTFSSQADVAYVEGANSYGQMFSGANEVHGLAVLFNTIRSAALSADETKDLIRTMMEEP